MYSVCVDISISKLKVIILFWYQIGLNIVKARAASCRMNVTVVIVMVHTPKLYNIGKTEISMLINFQLLYLHQNISTSLCSITTMMIFHSQDWQSINS